MTYIRPLPKSNLQIKGEAEILWKTYSIVSEKHELSQIANSFDLCYEEFIYPQYEIVVEEECDLGHSSTGEKVLGKYLPSQNLALIDASISRRSGDPRREFTLWHEVAGHGISQGAWLRSQLCEEVLDDRLTLSLDSERQLERQANIFAAHFAVPAPLLIQTYQKIIGNGPIKYIGPGSYGIGFGNGWKLYPNVESITDLARWVGGHLQFFFGRISKEMLGYRILEEGLIHDFTEEDSRDVFSLDRRVPSGNGLRVAS